MAGIEGPSPVFPSLGLGTWHMGEDPRARKAEVEALRLGLELGVGLIDTAEMYGEGGAEEVVGEAIRGRREQVFVVSKFYPHHAAPAELYAACERSRRRLGVDTIDCYLYHWRGRVPLARTVEALSDLAARKWIGSWGVSNFDIADLEELVAIPGGGRVATNQVLYNLNRRGIEFDLLPWCRDRAVAVMAYSPLDEGPLARHPVLAKLSRPLGIGAAQLALAWVLRAPGVCAIPKASRPEHVRANVEAARIALPPEVLRELDAAFPPPSRRKRLEII